MKNSEVLKRYMDIVLSVDLLDGSSVCMISSAGMALSPITPIHTKNPTRRIHGINY